MLRVSLVTIVAREMRLKIFLKSTKLLRFCECRWSQGWRSKCECQFFCRSRGYVGSAPTVTILAREMPLKVFQLNLVTWPDALGNLFKVCWKNVNFQSHIPRQYRDYWSSQHLQGLFCSKTFNRTSRANFMTGGTLTTQAQRSWLDVSIAYPAPISWQYRSCSQSHVLKVKV